MSRKINGKTVERGIYETGGYLYVRIANVPKLYIGPLSEAGIIDKAHIELHKLRDSIRAGKLGQEVRATRWTVAKGCEEYWKREASKMPSAFCISTYIQRITENLGNKFLDTVTFQDVKDFRVWLDHDKKLSPLNINRHHTYLTRLFNVLKLWRRTKVIENIRLPEENPGTMVTRPKETWRKNVLTIDEFDKLVAAASPKLQRILIVGIHTLLRCKDMDALSISKNVNWSQNHLEGLQAKVSNEYVLPINGQLMSVLESTEGDKVLDFSNFRKELRQARTKANLPGLKMTDIRRTGARWMLKMGIDIATVSRYLGHTSIEMTQRYVGADTTDMRRGAVILDGLFKMPKRDTALPMALVANQ